MNILVIDDDPLVRDALAELLRSESHTVACVGMGTHALSRSLANDYDLVLCDIMLPDLDGVEVIRALKAQAPLLPVVVVSGADPQVWQKPCEDAGAATFLAKPVPPADILYEVSLVQKARLTLRVALVDTDTIHRTRLAKTLGAIGCHIQPYASAAEAIESLGDPGAHPALWVADASDPDIFKLLKNVLTDRVPVFAFAADASNEENLMRAGAALFLPKPIDIDTLLTQASFLAR